MFSQKWITLKSLIVLQAQFTYGKENFFEYDILK